LRLSPVSLKNLIKGLRRLGWKGPVYKSDHPFMLKEDHPPLKIPNPHGEDISVDLLVRILRQAEISRKEWLETN
jgi:predicted RNA binding protein YcfA (HicA-like mRNA interferase family)